MRQISIEFLDGQQLAPFHSSNWGWDAGWFWADIDGNGRRLWPSCTIKEVSIV